MRRPLFFPALLFNYLRLIMNRRMWFCWRWLWSLVWKSAECYLFTYQKCAKHLYFTSVYFSLKWHLAANHHRSQPFNLRWWSQPKMWAMRGKCMCNKINWCLWWILAWSARTRETHTSFQVRCLRYRSHDICEQASWARYFFFTFALSLSYPLPLRPIIYGWLLLKTAVNLRWLM